MSEDILEALASPTVGVTSAGRVLGIGRGAAYRAIRDGSLPTIKIGGQYRVPTAKLREMLGLPPLQYFSGPAPLAA